MGRGPRIGGSDVTPEQARAIGRACSVFALRRATRAVTQLYDDVLRPTGLRATQYSVLAVIRASEPATQTEIARTAQMDATTLTRALRPLEREGLVRVRLGATDRRQRVVSLTAKGKRRLTRATAYWEKAQEELSQRYGTVAVRELVGALHAAARATKHGSPHPPRSH